MAHRPLAAGTGPVSVLILVVLIVVAVIAAATLAFAGRRTLIERAGSVTCALLRAPAGHWELGLAGYQPDELRWHPVFGVRLRPSAVFRRATLTVRSRRPAAAQEVPGMGPGTVIVQCDTGGDDGGRVGLALSEDALTGFLAWLEAAPPGEGTGFS